MANVNDKTVAAAVRAAAVLLVNVAMLFGVSLDLNLVIDLMCAAAMIGATAYGIYRNFNFTKAAQRGQELTDAIKRADRDDDWKTELIVSDEEEL